jgi:hypothetical protein
MNRMAPAGARHGHIVDGEATLGKSTIIKTFGRNHELYLRRRRPELFAVPCRDFTPVVYISVPDGATPKGLSERFAEYLGLPVRAKASNTEVTSAVLKSLKKSGTQLVLIDDIHFLDCSQKEGKLANDHLKYLANYCPATFIYAGIEVAASNLFTEGTSKRKTQTSGRFSLLPVKPFAQDLLQDLLTPRANLEEDAEAKLERQRVDDDRLGAGERPAPVQARGGVAHRAVGLPAEAHRRGHCWTLRADSQGRDQGDRGWQRTHHAGAAR